MRQITSDQLRGLGACPSQVDLFEDTFGKSAEMTESNADRAADVGLDVEWLARHVLPPKQWAEYQRVCAREFVRIEGEAE